MAQEHTNEEQEEQQEMTHEEYEWLQSQLRQHGIELVEKDEDEWEDPFDGKLTELLEACETCNLDVAKEILSEGNVDVNAPGPDGDKPLNIACLYGHTEMVQLLLENGADAAKVNEMDGSTPHHDAAAGGYLEILKLLVEKAPEALKICDEDGDTVLHNAARGDHKEVVEYLLSQGADPKAKNSEGNTPEQEAEEEEVKAVLAAATKA